MIKNPVTIGFDPTDPATMADEEQGVSLQTIWADPLTRTMWLVLRARYLISDYFRANLLVAVKRIRAAPQPISERDLGEILHRIPDFQGDREMFLFAKELLPYVLGQTTLEIVVKPKPPKGDSCQPLQPQPT